MIPDQNFELKSTQHISELDGNLAPSEDEEQKLMRTVTDADKKEIDDGKLILDSINQGVGQFQPDLMFEQLVKNYSIAKKLFGEKIIRYIAGYDPDYVKKNINVPEFQRIIKDNIKQNIKELEKKDVLDKEGRVTDKGIELASVELYMEELDKLVSKGFLGEYQNKNKHVYGERSQTRLYKSGDRYKDLSVRQSVKLALRRQHKELDKDDLKVHDRISRGQYYIVFCLDASSSMKGQKIALCKKAGVALAYKAITERNKVGLVVFGSEIRASLPPTDRLKDIIEEITKVKALQQTNIEKSIEKAAELFPRDDVTKHLILLTDVLPTEGQEPEKETLEAVSKAVSAGITISLVGINLDKKGEKLAEKIVEMAQGRFYVVKNLQELDKIILEEYGRIR